LPLVLVATDEARKNFETPFTSIAAEKISGHASIRAMLSKSNSAAAGVRIALWYRGD
jgi:hypothetical protein